MLNKQKHQIVLIKILKDIYKNSKLSNQLVFKGGTCAYFFYKLNRFSTDLDFSLIGTAKKELILDEIKKITSKYGEIKDAWIKQNTILVEMSYGLDDYNVKIEISTRKEKIVPELKNYLGIDILAMSQADLFANKLLALLERKKTANRDIYDLYFFFKNNFSINSAILKEQTDKSLNEYLEDVKKFITKINQNKILDGLGEVLDEKEKNWIKQNLIKELIWEIDLYVQTLKNNNT